MKFFLKLVVNIMEIFILLVIFYENPLDLILYLIALDLEVKY